jgi:hypothetical protein
MKPLPSMEKKVAGVSPATETLILSGQHLDFLQRISFDLNPDMHRAFGWPHAIRTILDRFEASGLDLTEASSEEEIVRIGAGHLKIQGRRRRARSIEPLCASGPSRSADRRGCRAILPGRDRRRSGKPPRSDRG